MKQSKCSVCGVPLPIKAWRRCRLHDGSKVAIEEMIQLKPFVPMLVLDEKKYFKRPFQEYMGYSIEIPFEKFINASELIVDNDKWKIIGWK